jgi:pimeloyl-ACP methyl ester carboxylesterase
MATRSRTTFPIVTLGCWACWFLAAGAGEAWAQKSPYDVFPPAEPPYYRVRYEPSAGPGERRFGVNYTIWIPPNVKTLRGVVVHQHGCGEGSCKSGLTGAYDLHWQALARKHDCALLAPAYEQPEKADCQLWCDPRNGSAAAFQKGLADLGKKSGHPELARVPWALWGHSGGGHWAGGMVMLHPDRVAAAWLRSGVPLLKDDPKRTTIKAHKLPAAALAVPIMCNLGTKEGVTEKAKPFAGVWPANEVFFNEVRSKGGLIGVAIDPLTSHECGNQRYLAIPWLDVCLTARLPKATGEPLRPMPRDSAWLAPVLGGEAVPAAKFASDPRKASWLPNAAIGQAWMEYGKDTKVTDTTPPPAPMNVRLQGNTLTWDATADLESGLASFLIERDGQVIAMVPAKARNPFGRPLFQGLQYSDTPPQPLVVMKFIDTKAEAGKAHQYRVIAVNTVGLKSAPTAARVAATGHRLLVQGNGKLALVDAAGHVEWDMPWGGIHDLHVLPSGNIMVQQGAARVVEIDPRTRKVVWSYDSATMNGNRDKPVEVHAFQPLEGGKVLIAESGIGRLIEVDRSGKLEREIKLKRSRPSTHHDTRLVRKLASGNYLVCHENDGAVREYDPRGAVVWEYDVPLFDQKPHGGHGPEAWGNQTFAAVRLKNGNTLITTGNGHGVLEVTPQKEIVWQIRQRDLPNIVLAWVTTIEVLPNGNYVLGNCHAGRGQPLLVEIEPATKRVVWTFDQFDRWGNAVSNTKILD